MIIPFKDETSIFRCGVCGKYFRRGNGMVSCCVLHPPGDCCHFNDRPISDEQMKRIKEITEEA